MGEDAGHFCHRILIFSFLHSWYWHGVSTYKSSHTPFLKRQTVERIPAEERQINYLFYTLAGCFQANQCCCASRGDEKNKSHIPNATVRTQQSLHKLCFHLVSPASLLWRVFSTNTPGMVIPRNNLKFSQYFGPLRAFFPDRTQKTIQLKLATAAVAFAYMFKTGLL